MLIIKSPDSREIATGDLGTVVKMWNIATEDLEYSS